MASGAVRGKGALWGAIVSLSVILAVGVVNHAPSTAKRKSELEVFAIDPVGQMKQTVSCQYL